ncbi:MAG TPA: hypothetical protein PLF11_16685, partial [Bacillota bacterium]|nr:hypothetical protein [Bacillota bacterium]
RASYRYVVVPLALVQRLVPTSRLAPSHDAQLDSKTKSRDRFNLLLGQETLHGGIRRFWILKRNKHVQVCLLHTRQSSERVVDALEVREHIVDMIGDLR